MKSLCCTHDDDDTCLEADGMSENNHIHTRGNRELLQTITKLQLSTHKAVSVLSTSIAAIVNAYSLIVSLLPKERTLSLLSHASLTRLP